MLGVLRSLTDDLDGARTQLEAARIEALELGDEGSLPLILRYLSSVELSSGDWNAAERWAGRVRGSTADGTARQQFALAGVAGPPGRAPGPRRRHAGGPRRVWPRPRRTGAAFGRMLSDSALGHLELSEGTPAEPPRDSPLAEPRRCRMLLAEPAWIFACDPTAIGLIAHARRARAGRAPARRSRTPGSRALSRLSARERGRCRGLLLAAGGDATSAVARIEEALSHDALGALPFERASDGLPGARLGTPARAAQAGDPRSAGRVAPAVRRLGAVLLGRGRHRPSLPGSEVEPPPGAR